MNQIKRTEIPGVPQDNRDDESKKVPRFAHISLLECIELIGRICGKTVLNEYGTKNNNGDILIILPMAARELYTMLYWGDYHPINRDEQLYEGIGHIFIDGDRRIVVVSHFMYIYAAERTPTSARIMKDGVFNSVMSRIEYEVNIYRQNEIKYNVLKDGILLNPFLDIAGSSRPVLYGHTHPNLGCFFSPDDKVSGFASQTFPAVTFVADPIRKEMKAGVGMELKDAKILVYSYVDDSKSNIKDKTIRGSQIDKAYHLISEICDDCNELLNPLYGANGKFISYTTITGAQKIKMTMTWKPGKGV